MQTTEQLSQAVDAWQEHSVIGLDTEFVRERTYRAALGLVQISDGQTAWLVDPVSVKDLAPLASFMANPSVEKIIHSGSEDFEVMYHQIGAVPESAVDSQVACALLGQSLQLGYHNAANWLLDVEVDKDQTRSNWLRRPLSQRQLRYAALDVTLLPLMMDRMRGDLERQNRWDWLREEVARMERKSIADLAPEVAWKRVGGAGSLNDPERCALQALAAWREETALAKNLARGFVVSDQALLGIAKALPSSPPELKPIEGLHPKVVARHGDKWLELIEQSRKAEPVPPLPQLSGLQRNQIKTMRARVNTVAKSLNVDAALLASRKQLEQLIHAHAAAADIPERFGGWRKAVITDDLLQILDG